MGRREQFRGEHFAFNAFIFVENNFRKVSEIQSFDQLFYNFD